MTERKPFANVDELYDALKLHDWTYSMSDDHRVWSSGNENAKFLRAEAERMDETVLFSKMAAWGWGDGPLPLRPSSSS
jgi:hypothetical protein